MITINNLSLDAATEAPAMDAITGGCYFFRPRGCSRRYVRIIRKCRRPRRCYRRPVSCRPIYRPLPFPGCGVTFK